MSRRILSEYGVPAELFSSLAITLFGLWLVMPWNTFAMSPNYAFMASIAPDWVWGWLFTGSGAAALYGLFWRQSRVHRSALLLVFMSRAFLFGAVAYSTHGMAQGVPDFFMWSSLAAWAYVRTSLKHNDAKTRRE